MLPRCLLSAHKPNTWDGWQWVLVGVGEFIGTKRTIINSKILTDKKKDLLCEVYLMPCCEET